MPRSGKTLWEEEAMRRFSQQVWGGRFSQWLGTKVVAWVARSTASLTLTLIKNGDAARYNMSIKVAHSPRPYLMTTSYMINTENNSDITPNFIMNLTGH